MTDRLNALIVVLDTDIRDDAAQPIIDAIKLLKGIIAVEPNIVNIDSQISEARAKQELRIKLWEVLK